MYVSKNGFPYSLSYPGLGGLFNFITGELSRWSMTIYKAINFIYKDVKREIKSHSY